MPLWAPPAVLVVPPVAGFDTLDGAGFFAVQRNNKKRENIYRDMIEGRF